MLFAGNGLSQQASQPLGSRRLYRAVLVGTVAQPWATANAKPWVVLSTPNWFHVSARMRWRWRSEYPRRLARLACFSPLARPCRQASCAGKRAAHRWAHPMSLNGNSELLHLL